MNEFLKSILDGINSVIGNYGWSIMIFTLLIRLVLSPFDYKSRKSMRKTQKLQPQIAALQKKYKNDKEKLNQKTAELYKKERINPLSGCLPMLLSLPVLFAMFAAMRMIANEQIANHVFTYLSGGQPTFEGWLWVKNIWMPDSPFTALVPDANSIKQITLDIWQAVYNGFTPEFLAKLPKEIIFDFTNDTTMHATVQAMITNMQQMPVYQNMLGTVPGLSNLNLIFAQLSVFAHYNGFFILPVLAAVTQFLMTALMPQQQPVPQEGQSQNPMSGNFMKWFFPIFSLFICSSYNAGFALYWVTANLIAAGQNMLFNKYFDAQDKKAAAMGEGTVK